MISNSDRKFRESVENCDWPGGFSHEDHIRLGWIYLQEFETDDAIVRCGNALRGLAESHGDFEKYHETLTVAMMHLIARHIEGSPDQEDWPAFRLRSRSLFDSAKELLARHYSQERLAQPEARNKFLPPDRDPL